MFLKVAEVKLKIDGKEVVVEEGTTILEAAKKVGVEIPTLCHLDGLTPWGGCRLCVVEIKNAPRLFPACVTPVADGMEVYTDTEQVKEARRFVMDLLMSERNHFCMYCEKSGRSGETDCLLQQRAYELEIDHFEFPVYVEKYPVDNSSPVMVVDHNRCILCGRCVRACSEIASNWTLNYSYRGHDALIACDAGVPKGESSCVSCGMCLQVCPTGTLYSKYGAYKGKKSTSEKIDTYCPICGVGCEMRVYVTRNNVVAIDGLGIEKGTYDGGQLCRKGRFDPIADPRKRLKKAVSRDNKGNLVEVNLEEAVNALSDALKKYSSSEVAVRVSSFFSEETLSAVKSFVEKLDITNVDTFDGDIYRNLKDVQYLEAKPEDILEAEFIILVGGDIVENHGVIGSCIRKAVQKNKASFVVVSSESSKIDRWANSVYKLSKDTEGQFAKMFLSALGVDIKDTMDEMARLCGLGHLVIGEIKRYAEKIKRTEKAVIILEGSELLRNKEAINLWSEVAKISNSKLMILLPCSNCKVAWDMGLASDTEMSSEGMKALLIFVGDQDASYKPSLLGRVGDYEFVGLYSAYVDPTMKVADVVIPGTIYLEESGTYLKIDGTKFKTKSALKPHENAIELKELLNKLV